MPIRKTLAGALVFGLLSTAVSAQDDGGYRRGFAGAAAIGISTAGISCSPQCSADRESGPAMMFRIGGNITSQFVLGVEATLFRADVKNLTPPGKWALSWLTLSALWYPSADDDFFIKFGAGIASTRVDVPFPDVGSIQLTSSDFGAKVGIGKDFLFTDKLALTAFADVLFTPKSQALTSGSNSGAKLSADLIHLGLAVTVP